MKEAEDSNSEAERSDVVSLLVEAEALELVEFVTPKNTWDTPKPIIPFLEKYFNKALLSWRNFPSRIVVSSQDEQVKEHLKMKGKDPHFGSEKLLYKLQEQMLDVAGPLTCLWADLLNNEAHISAEDTPLLVQRALVLLGSASHAISQKKKR